MRSLTWQSFGRLGFKGFDGVYQGEPVSTSVAHAFYAVVEEGDRYWVAVNVLLFAFNDETTGPKATLDLMPLSGVHNRLMEMISKYTNVGDIDVEGAELISTFCKELTAADTIEKVGQEAVIYFFIHSDPVLFVAFPREPKEKVMHEASLRLMAAALERYDASDPDRGVNVLDVGSYNINGSYRELITQRGWLYTGLDIMPGDNVNIYTENPYRYPINTGQFDIVISGSVAYAVLDLVSWTKELVRVLRPGGLLVVVTPSLAKPPTTQSPIDLWRMTDDALIALFQNTLHLDDIQAVTSHHDVCASAIRVHGEIDERRVAPESHEFSVPGGTPVADVVNRKVIDKAKTTRAAVKTKAKAAK